jgi:5-methylcytosine-specific restriction endonuclease McrA
MRRSDRRARKGVQVQLLPRVPFLPAWGNSRPSDLKSRRSQDHASAILAAGTVESNQEGGEIMETLVLDISYMPHSRISWQDAITKILVDRTVQVIDEYEDKTISTVNWTVKMPSVIRLMKPVKKKQAVKFSRHAVYARDKGRCQYCGAKVSMREMQYEHVIPRAQGGKTNFENIVVSCLADNQRKGGRTPEQAGMRLLTKPVRPKSLPERGNFDMAYRSSMPGSWKQYLRDEVYWRGELEQD